MKLSSPRTSSRSSAKIDRANCRSASPLNARGQFGHACQVRRRSRTSVVRLKTMKAFIGIQILGFLWAGHIALADLTTTELTGSNAVIRLFQDIGRGSPEIRQKAILEIEVWLGPYKDATHSKLEMDQFSSIF